ncbi:MAG: HIT domain-containing protein [bacterium]
MRNNLFVPSKLEYVRGQRPKVACILCAVADNDERVERLVVYREAGFIVSLNLYPYSPGHLMIFPERHVLDIRELNDEEGTRLHQLTKLSLDILERIYQPYGFNLGYNIGRPSGASLEHLHLHIVPRYGNEVGFLDVINGARVIVEDPLKTREKLKDAFQNPAVT